MLILVSGGVVLTVDSEARASFFAWVKEIYENSIIYQFFNEPQEEGLPSYELGWLPEGYEAVDVYQSETLYNVFCMKGEDVDSAFVFEYSFGANSTLVEILADESKYECKKVTVNGVAADFYRSLDGSETNNLIWLNEQTGIVFMINGYLEESVMLHIAEGVKLCNVPK